MTRQRALQVVQRDEGLLPRIRTLKAEHPFWGYRRVWAYLRLVEQLPVHKTRVLRLMREHGLLVPPNVKLKAKRTPTGSKPRPITPNEWWGSDLTKVLVQGVGWVSSVVVLDWYTTAVVGDEAGIRCTTQQWLQALARAVNRQFSQGAREQGLSLMSDHGCQPTSHTCMEACSTLGYTKH
jgi:putative transposase